VQLEQSFEIAESIDKVWAAFGDLAATASCIPGSEIGSVKENRVVEGLFRVQIGPIKAAFAGEAEVSRNDQDYSGAIVGAGSDGKNAARVKAIVNYKLVPVSNRVTRVDLVVDYSMSGPLAQIARSAIVKELANGLVRTFAGNLEQMLSAQTAAAIPAASSMPSASSPKTVAVGQSVSGQQSINLVSLVFPAIWRRILAIVRPDKG
jgi:carbon-monoxide dehydrogenase small subunit